jgi:hypothetical protein
MRTTKSALLIGIIFLGACGDSEPDKGYGEARPMTEQEAVAMEGLMDSVGGLSSLADDPSSESAWGYVAAMFGQQNLLLQGKLAAQYETTSNVARATSVASLLDCVDSSADGRSVTYDQCEVAGITLDGVLRWWEEGGGVAFETDLRLDYGSAGMTTQMVGTLLVTDTAIRTLGGRGMRFETTMRSGDISINTDIESEWDIQITSGCATGGFLELHGTTEVSGSVIDTWMLMEMGPACGQVTIR